MTRFRSGTGTGTDDVVARLAALEKSVEQHARELAVQLQRIAQLQADLDAVRGVWVQLKLPPVSRRVKARRRYEPRS